ncbi:BamA/TamA family outer membrane protein [Oscillatoriales cyanobacterium LEGE 11467]|uniref:BamA/TamA family outer membrane protein n=1 Tax=Zarconia navalis LEGE 11467 TaxID=1828826 RepID=A0A928Z782_9CYAN|nr:BamA/TamA family outer membrane protein [Zarconia navalis]MBE9041182.1 BamA/TamA family outer membrane protein [Zarconia navalis LEGE 11467]
MKLKYAKHSKISLALAVGASSIGIAVTPSWAETLPKSARTTTASLGKISKSPTAISSIGQVSKSATGSNESFRVTQTTLETAESSQNRASQTSAESSETALPTVPSASPNSDEMEVREPGAIDPQLQQLQRQGLSTQQFAIDYRPQEPLLSAREIQFKTEPVDRTQLPQTELTDFTTVQVGQLTDAVRGPFRIEDPVLFTPTDLEERETGFFFSIFPNSNRAKGAYGVATLGATGSGGNILELEIEGGQQTAGLDLSYTQAAIVTENDSSIGYRISAFTARSPNDNFLAGGTTVFLPMGFRHVPWVNRTGGEVSLFVPSSKNFVFIPRVRYQNVQISRGAFNDEDIPRDERGNRLSFADDGTDDLLSVGLAAQYVDVTRDRLADVAVEGTKFQLGTEQFIPIGDADVTANRLSGGLVQYFPTHLFGFAEGPSVFVMGLAAGTFIGDLPPYEAFSLGGSSSVRGYGDGGLGSGRSFVSATLEYRFPIANFRGDTIQNLRGALFVDYGSALGSQGNVTGQPGEERDKPGNGAGFGIGLGAKVDFLNYVWVDFALNDEGRTAFSLNVGERF